MKQIPACCLALTALVTFEYSIAQSQLVNPETEDRIDALISQMTLEEKVGQLNQYSDFGNSTGVRPEDDHGASQYDDLAAGRVGSMLNIVGADRTRAMQEVVVNNSRLGIPLIFGYDVIHGHRTMFPVPLAEAASWDMDAIELSARVAAREAAASGVHWTFAPMVDVSRDARWGRVMEGAGEDPWLHSRIAEARVRGFQGESLKDLDSVAATAKHFAGYGFPEGGRDYDIADISEQTLHNVVLPPFKAALDAGVATFMNSFNEVGGIPATADRNLQRDLLKGEWAFEGFMVSDWGSINELVPHGVAENDRHAAKLAITAGSDMDMVMQSYHKNLASLVSDGEVPEALIDEAVRRVLRVKFALGLFDDPYRYSDPEREKATLLHEDHLVASREVARKSMVLLSNDGILPLPRNPGTIAVIGPLADDKDSPLGNWRAQAVTDSAVSLLEGLQAATNTTIIYAQGAPLGQGERTFVNELEINQSDMSGFAEAVEAARRADVVVMALGEDAYQSGEGRSQAYPGLRGVQHALFDAVAEANPNIVVVLMNGRPLVLGDVAERPRAILEAWHAGSQAGHAIADVLMGDYNPSGKLPVTFPRHAGQIPLYYGRKSTGRPGPIDQVFWAHYTDVSNEPQFVFGHGLSYTTFEFGEVTLSHTEFDRSQALKVTVDVTNTGEREGTEVVQLYVRDLVGSVTRPLRELKGFEAVRLAPGEQRSVTFTLSEEDLSFWTRANGWSAEEGEFEVFVGGDSNAPASGRFRLTN